MKKLRFDSDWVALIMNRVNTVSYSVVLNGYSGENFFPSRGLRRGPVEPVLIFILCRGAF